MNKNTTRKTKTKAAQAVAAGRASWPCEIKGEPVAHLSLHDAPRLRARFKDLGELRIDRGYWTNAYLILAALLLSEEGGALKKIEGMNILAGIATEPNAPEARGAAKCLVADACRMGLAGWINEFEAVPLYWEALALGSRSACYPLGAYFEGRVPGWPDDERPPRYDRAASLFARGIEYGCEWSAVGFARLLAKGVLPAGHAEVGLKALRLLTQCEINPADREPLITFHLDKVAKRRAEILREGGNPAICKAELEWRHGSTS